MEIVLTVAGVVAGLLLLMAASGLLLGKEHTTRRTLRTPQPPEAVWKLISDFAGQAKWRSDVTAVERLADRDGRPVWLEKYVDSVPVVREVLEWAPPQRLVSRFSDEQGAPLGQWECEVAATDGGSRLTVAEHGLIQNPFFRFVGRYWTGHATFIEQYLLALSVELGEGSAIERRQAKGTR